MRKFLAVVKREYVQRVRSRMFLVVTVGAPLMFALFTVVPAMIAGMEGGGAQYYSRNVGDVFTRGRVQDGLTKAVRDARLAENNIRPEVMRAVNRPVKMATTKAGGGGEKADNGQGFFLVFGVGFVIYLTILMYGQVILGAVIEEKETRIAEILFSSIRSFPLMLGKLIGVSLVALTQFAIWGMMFAAFTLYGVAALASQGMPINFN